MKATMVGILIILLLSPVSVQLGEPELKLNPTQKFIWTDGIGSGFRKGVFQAGRSFFSSLSRKPLVVVTSRYIEQLRNTIAHYMIFSKS